MSNTARGIIDRVGYLPEERGLYKKMLVRRTSSTVSCRAQGVPALIADQRMHRRLERSICEQRSGTGATPRSIKALSRYAAKGPVHLYIAARP